MFSIDTTILNQRIEEAKFASEVLGREVPLSEVQVVDGIVFFAFNNKKEAEKLQAAVEKQAESEGCTVHHNDEKFERDVDNTLSQALRQSQVSSMLDNIFNKKM